jgi:hypothetical protein
MRLAFNHLAFEPRKGSIVVRCTDFQMPRYPDFPPLARFKP